MVELLDKDYEILRRKPAISSMLDIEKQACKIEVLDYRDFLQSQESNSVDLLLTDPPYAISRKTGFAKFKKGIKRFAVSMDFGAWDHQPIDLDFLCELSYKALRKGGTAIIWYDLWKISNVEIAMRLAGFKMLRLIIWQKNNPVPLNQSATYLSNSREIAVVGVKGGKPTFKDKYHNGIFNYPIPRHNGKRIHPTQKPLNLFSELVQIHSNEGDMIIDPFLGGGTTAVAAHQLQRKFQGCDINPNYVKASQGRIDEL